jgi:hypothetical protein
VRDIASASRRRCRPVIPHPSYAAAVAAEGLLITGVYGTGKSSLAAQIADLLEAQGVPYGAIDLDWLAWFDVGSDEAARRDVYLRNVRAVVGNERRAGVRRVVLAGSVRGTAEVDDLRAATGMPLRVVRLEVQLAEIERRLRDDPTTGRAEDARAAARWLQEGIGSDVGDLVISNEGDIVELARRVIDWLGW